MADGTIVIDTDLSTDKLKNKLNKLNNDIERQTGKVKSLQAEYDKLLSGEGAPAVNPAVEKLTKQLDKAKTDLDDYNAELEKIHQGTDIQLQSAETPEMVENVLQVEQVEIDKLNEKYAKQIALVQRLEAEIAKTPQTTADTASEAEKLRLQLEQAQIALEGMQTDASVVQSRLNGMNRTQGIAGNLNAAQASLAKFEKRLKTIAKKVFVFTMITAALRSVKAYMGQALKANEGFQESLARLKGTLRTAFQPILSFIIPVLQALINVLNVAMSYIAKFTSWLFDTTVDASAKAAKALNDQTKATKSAGAAAEKAKKQMSGLDEMNTWQNDKSTGGAGDAEISSVNFDGIKDAMSEIEVYISGALLAIGAILAFTGVSIPLGIALMAIGAAGLASAISLDWNTMPDGIKSSLTAVLAVLGGAGLVIGVILAFTGANLPLGIGLMLAGAAMLGSAVALNWGAIKEALQGTLGKIMAIVSGEVLVLGLILVLTGVGIPLGIGMILAGAAGLATVASVNWSSIVEKVKGPLTKIAAVASGASLALGLILVLTGVGIPLGIGLVLAGAKGLAKFANVDWGALLAKFKSVWASIRSWFSSYVSPIFTKKFWQDKFSCIKNAVGNSSIVTSIKSIWSSVKDWFKNSVSPKLTTTFWKNKFTSIKTALTDRIKGAVNAAIALFNKFVSWVNSKMKISWKGVKIAGQQIIPSGSVQLINLKKIPMLAQGGVIPANREFLAVLGDQKHGNNIEAPEGLIRKIVREESGSGTYTFIAQLNGRTIFREVIDQAKLSRKMTGKNAFAL